MLKDVAKSLLDTAHAKTDDPLFGTLSEIRLLDTPIYGEVNGEPVTIIGTGNMRGFSPVAWCVDGTRENAYLPVTAIHITDPRFVPLGAGATVSRR